MKKIALALPALAAILLGTSARTKHDDATSNTTISEVNSTEEVGGNSADLLSNDAGEAGNTSEPLGNAQ